MKKSLCLLLTAMLLFGGCKSKEEAHVPAPSQTIGTSPQAVDATAQVGGSLKLTMGVPKSLNPLVNGDASVDQVLWLMFEPLVRIDENRRVQPNIATGWSFDESGRVLTLHLDSGHNWHNGTQITAADVIYSLDTIAAVGETGVYSHCLDNIVSYEKKGENAVTITFATKFTGNLYYLEFPVISAAYYGGSNALASKQDMSPMGSGAFGFSEYRRGKELVLVGKANSFSSTPYIEKVVAMITPDIEAVRSAFDRGVTDALVSDMLEFSGYSSAKKAKFYPFTTDSYECMGINFKTTGLQDLAVRQALAMTTPKEAIVEGAYLGYGVVSDTPVNPNSWLYCQEEPAFVYDPAAAKALLSNAGWADSNGDGVRDKTINNYVDTLQFTILLNEESKERLQMAMRLKTECQAIGIELVIDSEPYDRYIEKLKSGQFDLFLAGWSLSSVPDIGFLLSSASEENYTGYASAEMDALLAAANSGVAEDEILEAYCALQQKIIEELPYISICFRQHGLFVSGRVAGDIVPTQSDPFDSIANWYIIE